MKLPRSTPWAAVHYASLVCSLLPIAQAFVLRPEPSIEPTPAPTVSSFPSTFPSVTPVPTASEYPSTVPSTADDLSNAAFPCFSDLLALYEDQTTRAFQEATVYILCPNTIFSVDEEYPLVAREMTTVKCGANGQSANNCILRGGEVQLQVEYNGFLDFTVYNYKVQGVTFEAASTATAFMTSEGSVEFVDCIFKNTQSFFQITAMYFPFFYRNRHLLERSSENSDVRLRREDIERYMSLAESHADEEDEDERELQLGFRRELSVSFMSCIFEGFKISPVDSELRSTGIVNARSSRSPITITDSIFRDNDMDDASPGCAILSFGAAISIENTCFFRNTFNGFGAVVVFSGSDVTSTRNFLDAASSTTCDFVAQSQVLPFRTTTVDCVDASESACAASIYDSVVLLGDDFIP